MESEKKETLEASIPVEALCEVLDHYWRDEVRNYREDLAGSHILHQLAVIANWLTGGLGREGLRDGRERHAGDELAGGHRREGPAA